MDVRSQRERGSDYSSSSRRRLMKQKEKPAAATRRVQVVYYLSRNGLLEHPHFMELTLFPNQPLRLKDVFDRLKALRGSGMPLQYSWSSKRNYKSGYVWHDLALKDIIHPAEEGGEYVLKGSELVQCSASERFQVSNKQAILQLPEPNYTHCNNSKHNKVVFNSAPEYEEHEEGEKTSSYTNTSSNTNTPHSRCSRGVSTEELNVDNEEEEDNDEARITNTTKVTTSSNSTTHADKVPKSNQGTESTRKSRHSVLLQLIACGSSALELNKATKHEPRYRLSNVGTTKKVFSEDPRLMQQCCEEKEYFSGSIVESMKALEAEPVLNRSNSHNEEQRRSKLGMMEEVKKLKVMEEYKNSVNKGGGGGVKERCIPCKKSSKDIKKLC